MAPYYPPAATSSSSSAPAWSLNSLPPQPRSGRWYSVPVVGAYGAVSLPTTAILGMPLVVPRTPSVALASINVRVATASSGVTVRGALYSVDAGTLESPATLVADLGTVDAGTTGVRAFSAPPATIAAGFYYLAATAVGGTATLGGVTSGSSIVPFISQPAANTLANGLSATAGTPFTSNSAWPSPLTFNGNSPSGLRFDLTFAAA